MTNCENCKAGNVCVVRKQLLNENNDAYRLICSNPNGYAAIMQGIRSLLAENCRYSQMSESVKEFVQRVWGDHTDEQREGLLWHCTAFPCVGVPELEKQLKKVKVESGGDYNLAMEQAELKMEQAMKVKE